MEKQDFLDRFRFHPQGAGLLGAEIEFFLAQPGNPFRPLPAAREFLREAGSAWGPELSACQVEYHTRPVRDVSAFALEVEKGFAEGMRRAEKMGLRLVAEEVGPGDMCLDVYPKTRYKRIVAGLPEPVLRAACRVAGIHIHLGVAGWQEAIEVHNRLALRVEEFIQLGDHSQGKRIRLYRVVAPQWKPPQYESRDHFSEVAREQGFLKEPRSCYHLVRLNPVGTVEIRAFGTTADIEEITAWAEKIRK